MQHHYSIMSIRTTGILFFVVWFSIGVGIPALGSEPDEQQISTVKLSDSSNIIRFTTVYHLRKVVTGAREILKGIVDNKLTYTEYVFDFGGDEEKIIVDHQFTSIGEALQFSFSLAYFEATFAKKESFGAHPLEREMHDLVNTDSLKSSYVSNGDYTNHPILNYVTREPGVTSGNIANYCGQNFGLDKLSHVFGDGFIMYNKVREGLLDGEDDVRSLSDLLERTYMGLDFTGVYSQTDIEANIQGLKFFNDLFSRKIISIDKEKNIVFNDSDVDICEYFTNDLSERYHPNKYRFLSKQHRVAYDKYMKEKYGKQRKPTKKYSQQGDGKDLGTYLLIIRGMLKNAFSSKIRKSYPENVLRAFFEYPIKPTPARENLEHKKLLNR